MMIITCKESQKATQPIVTFEPSNLSQLVIIYDWASRVR